MIIDNGRAMLVSISPPDEPEPDGTYKVTFIPIQACLDLLTRDTPLQGHLWLDVAGGELFYQHLHKRDLTRLQNWIAKGRYIAIAPRVRRGKLSRGIRFDARGKPVMGHMFSWRNPAKYLTAEQIHWLNMAATTSDDFVTQAAAVRAIAQTFGKLYKLASKRKKTRVKAKYRRKLHRAISQSHENIYDEPRL